MIFNLFRGVGGVGGRSTGESAAPSSIITQSDISLEALQTSREKVGVYCAGLRPLLQLFSNLGVLPSSHYPCLIQSLSLVAGIIMIYTQGYACVCQKQRGCVCAQFPQSGALCRFPVAPLEHLSNNVFPPVCVCVCVWKRQCVNLCACVCVSDSPPSICTPSSKSSVHLVTILEKRCQPAFN